MRHDSNSIPMVTKWGSEYKDPGSKPLINLSQGSPGEQPHPSLIERLSKVVQSPVAQQGDTTISGGSDSAAYGNVRGDVAMRIALVGEMKYVYGGKDKLDVDVQVEDIALTAGCNAAFMAAVMVVAERGDEVILPVPWYFNNEMTLRILGIEPVGLPVSAESGFLPSVEQGESLINPRTKAIVLVSPNNPSGITYPTSTIRAFADLAVKHKIALIIDETYRDFVTPGPPHDLFTPKDNWSWRSNVIHLFSFSKSYRVPGHRLGALVADKSVVDEVKKVLDCIQRHQVFRDTLKGSEWEIGASGAYFAILKHPFKGVSNVEISRRLASECGVVVLPLTGFVPSSDSSWDSWLRVSVANVGEEMIYEAATRIRDSGKALGYE
ncbi:PLP-dependent transferase [Rhizoctonia solani]|uniref:PLP-dependent transferase n=1 Tax=Rhizoctonia solani TaxID=456999 RepID=A0A8H7IBH3_9AGAM|nr:PLP-dependent transferase [Rhizoctonia solani]